MTTVELNYTFANTTTRENELTKLFLFILGKLTTFLTVCWTRVRKHRKAPSHVSRMLEQISKFARSRNAMMTAKCCRNLHRNQHIQCSPIPSIR